MAVCAQKAVLPKLSLNSCKNLKSSFASPLLRPWWQNLSDSLSMSVVANSRKLHQKSFVARAAAEEVESEAQTESPRVKLKALTKSVKHIMTILDQEAIAAAKAEKEIPQINPGDVLSLKVEVPQNKRRLAVIKGIVIAKHNNGINSTFRIRRVMAGVGVEMVFLLYSPSIKEIKVIDKKKVRRAKLYYLRDKLPKFSTVK